MWRGVEQVSKPICLCPASSEYDPPCPKCGVLGIGVTGTGESASSADVIATMLADEQTLRNWLRSHGHGIALDVGRRGVNVAIELLSEAAGSFSLLSRSPHASYHAGPWAQRVSRDPADSSRIESMCRSGAIPYPWGCAQSSSPISDPDIYIPRGAFRDDCSP